MTPKPAPALRRDWGEERIHWESSWETSAEIQRLQNVLDQGGSSGAPAKWAKAFIALVSVAGSGKSKRLSQATQEILPEYWESDSSFLLGSEPGVQCKPGASSGPHAYLVERRENETQQRAAEPRRGRKEAAWATRCWTDLFKRMQTYLCLVRFQKVHREF